MQKVHKLKFGVDTQKLIWTSEHSILTSRQGRSGLSHETTNWLILLAKKQIPVYICVLLPIKGNKQVFCSHSTGLKPTLDFGYFHVFERFHLFHWQAFLLLLLFRLPLNFFALAFNAFLSCNLHAFPDDIGHLPLFWISLQVT